MLDAGKGKGPVVGKFPAAPQPLQSLGSELRDLSAHLSSTFQTHLYSLVFSSTFLQIINDPGPSHFPPQGYSTARGSKGPSSSLPTSALRPVPQEVSRTR